MWGNPGEVGVISAFQERGPFPDDQGLPHLSVSALPPHPASDSQDFPEACRASHQVTAPSFSR